MVPTLVVGEVGGLLRHLGWRSEVRFLGDLAAGNFTIEPLNPADLLRIAELVAEYRDLPLGSVDASVIAAAERRGLTEIATVDPHFAAVRPSHADAFALLP